MSGLIWSIVKRFIGRGYDTEDLYQIGCIGFIKAIKRFDTNFEVRLSTYAVPYILGEIKRFIRDDGPIKISRGIKELSIKIATLQSEYFNKFNDQITISKLSEILKVPKEDIIMALEASTPINSIDEEINIDNKSENKINLIDKLSSKKDETSMIVNKITINKIIEKLNSRDKQIILLRYYKDKTQTQVSKILGISQVQVSRIERKILETMKKELA